MKPELKEQVNWYFKHEFVDALLDKLVEGHNLSSFNVNPFLITALSKGVLGETTPANMAKSLLYPRIFGTSLSTSFGDKFQKFCIHVMGAKASGVPGMDIEFQDMVDKNILLMQVKAGPNTINAGDVQPIIEGMKSTHRLLIQNRTTNLPTFAIGVFYGTHDDISGHYKKIESSSIGSQLHIPVLVGKEFWHRLSGDENFYADLITTFFELFEEADYRALFNKDVKNLAHELEEKYFTKGKFDIKKI